MRMLPPVFGGCSMAWVLSSFFVFVFFYFYFPSLIPAQKTLGWQWYPSLASIPPRQASVGLTSPPAAPSMPDGGRHNELGHGLPMETLIWCVVCLASPEEGPIRMCSSAVQHHLSRHRGQQTCRMKTDRKICSGAAPVCRAIPVPPGVFLRCLPNATPPSQAVGVARRRSPRTFSR